jgi:hypothetical protein
LNRRIGLLFIAAVAFAAFTGATCSKAGPAGVTPVLKLTITDHVYYHNMGITWDGTHYITVNGGNSDYGSVNEYDRKGKLVATHDIGVDGRAVFWHAEDEELYVKVFGTSLYTLDLEDEDYDPELDDVLFEENSSIGFAPDGEVLYELSDGEVRVYEFLTGEEIETFDLSMVSDDDEKGFDMSIAVSDKYLFVWGEDDDTVVVYDLSGEYVTKFELPVEGFGFSLSWANNMLWVAEDADGTDDGADGTWHGYQLKGLD